MNSFSADELASIETLFGAFSLTVRDEIFYKPAKYIDYPSNQNNYLFIRLDLLPKLVPFYNDNSPVYEAVLKVRTHKYSLLKKASIDFTGHSSTPTLNIDFHYMCIHVKSKGINRMTNYNRNKVSYNPEIITNMYITLNLKTHVGAIYYALDSVTNSFAKASLG